MHHRSCICKSIASSLAGSQLHLSRVTCAAAWHAEGRPCKDAAMSPPTVCARYQHGAAVQGCHESLEGTRTGRIRPQKGIGTRIREPGSGVARRRTGNARVAAAATAVGTGTGQGSSTWGPSCPCHGLMSGSLMKREQARDGTSAHANGGERCAPGRPPLCGAAGDNEGWQRRRQSQRCHRVWRAAGHGHCTATFAPTAVCWKVLQE